MSRIAFISFNAAIAINATASAKSYNIKVRSYGHLRPEELIDQDIVILDIDDEERVVRKNLELLSQLSCYCVCSSRTVEGNPFEPIPFKIHKYPITRQGWHEIIAEHQEYVKKKATSAVNSGSPEPSVQGASAVPSQQEAIETPKEDSEVQKGHSSEGAPAQAPDSPPPNSSLEGIDGAKPTAQYMAIGEREENIDTSIFDPSVIDNDRIMDSLEDLVVNHYSGEGEEAYFKSVGLEGYHNQEAPSVKKPIIVIVEDPLAKKPENRDIASQFTDDALNVYRAQKLRKKQMSAADIEKKIREMIANDASRSNTSLFFDKNISKELEEKSIRTDDGGRQEFLENKNEIEEQKREAIFGNSPMQSPVPAPRRTESVVPKSSPAEEMSADELRTRLNKSLTPEQIDKLRKLGVKI